MLRSDYSDGGEGGRESRREDGIERLSPSLHLSVSLSLRLSVSVSLSHAKGNIWSQLEQLANRRPGGLARAGFEPMAQADQGQQARRLHEIQIV